MRRSYHLILIGIAQKLYQNEELGLEVLRSGHEQTAYPTAMPRPYKHDSIVPTFFGFHKALPPFIVFAPFFPYITTQKRNARRNLPFFSCRVLATWRLCVKKSPDFRQTGSKIGDTS
jgi:hypothetical protein